MKRTRKPTIFLVEDDIVLAQMYAIKLESAGYKVKIYHDGRSCLQALNNLTPKLIVLDIILPKLNGFQIIKEIKKNPRLRHCPVIILTNLTQADTNLTDSLARSLGICNYLVKSKTTPAKVLESVHRVLSGSPIP